jgi:hypothetical protein
MGKDGVSAATPETGVLMVKDYDLFHRVSVDVLAELQRIKATRDEAALKKLFAEKAPTDAAQRPEWKAVIERGSKLAITAGAVEEPWRLSHDGKYRTLCEKLLVIEAATGWRKM